MIHCGDALTVLRALPDTSVNCCITSPPYYGLRDYGCAGQIGLESTPAEYIARLVEVFREVRRVLKDDGTLWVNIGDSYASSRPCRRRNQIGAGSLENGKREARAERMGPGLKEKDLIGVPWMLAFALRDDGWYLRSDLIWNKPNPMPESVKGSHYSRHRVTIKEYERLSSLRYVDECAGDDWAGNMPRLSEREVSSSKAPLSKQSQGNRNGASQGIPRGSAGEAETVQPFAVREAEQNQIREDRQRESHSGEGCQEICGVSAGETSKRHQAPEDKRRTDTAGAKESGDSQIQANGQGEIAEPSAIREEEGRNPCVEQSSDGCRVGRNCDSARGALPLLQGDGQVDAGSRDTSQQGRAAHEGQRGASLPAVQFEEAGQDPNLLVGCPGCPKCIQHHGYIFHLSAGRCTKSHEYIFMLSKSARYWCDMDAVSEPATYAGKIVTLGEKSLSKGQANGANVAASGNGRASEVTVKDRRNLRSVWTLATLPTPEAHFATFPIELPETCLRAGCPEGGTVLDPFAGAGTTGLACLKNGRKFIGIELNAEYIRIAEGRMRKFYPLMAAGGGDLTCRT